MLAFEREVADSTIFGPLIGWWTMAHRSTGQIPSREALQPEDLPGSTFSHLLLAQFVEDQGDLRCHVIGDHIRSIVRQDWKGRLASQSAADAYFRDYLLPLYRQMAGLRRPIQTLNRLGLEGSRMVVLARLIMPLRANAEDDAVRFVLGAICIHAFDASSNDDLWRDVVDHVELERLVL
jgi:hypothetical protein